MKNSQRKIYLLLKRIILSLIILLFSVLLLLYIFGESILNKNLSDYIAKKTNNLYQLSFTHIDIKLNPLCISISDLNVAPDIELAKKLKKNHPDKSFYAFSSDEIKFNNLQLAKLIRDKSLYCSEITTVKPLFEISNVLNNKKNSTKSYDQAITDLHPFLNRNLKEIVIDQINFIDANYKLYKSVDNLKQISNADKISITIKKFVTSHELLRKKSLYFDSEDIVVRMDGFKNNMGDSLHILTIDTLDYSLKSADIYAKGFHLKPIRNNPKESLYDVYVPFAYVQSKNISNFALNDSIDIQFLKFDQAKIKFYEKENSVKKELGEIKQLDLYSVFKSQFSQIKIDSFILSNAQLAIFKMPDFNKFNQNFESINITLNDFVIDSLSSFDKNKLLYANDILMQIKGYSLKLNKNQHIFKAGELFVSTKDKRLNLKKISIKPPKKNNLHPLSEINIDCNSLEIEGVDFKKLYHSRVLPTEKITISEPIIQLSNKNSASNKKKQKKSGVFLEILSEYLLAASSDKVEITKGLMNIKEVQEDKTLGFFETDFNIILNHFSLETNNWQNAENIFFAHEFDVHFSNYKMRLIDNLHQLTVHEIAIVSADNKFQMDSVLFEPVIQNVTVNDMKNYKRSEIYRLSVPRISMTDVNLQDAFFNNQLHMANFQVSNPEIYFENFGTLKKEKAEKEPVEIFPLLFNYVLDFDIKNISIPNGKITWINHSKAGKTIALDNAFSAEFNNFKLNEAEVQKERLLFSEDFNITIQDQFFELSDSVHILEAAEINVSTETSGLKIQNAKLYPNKFSPNFDSIPSTYNIDLPLVEIRDFDFIKALYSREYKAGLFLLDQPKIAVFSKSENTKSLDFSQFQLLLPSAIKSLNLNELKINNGEVVAYNKDSLGEYIQSKFTIDLSIPKVAISGTLEKEAHIELGNVITSLTDFKTTLGKKHNLEIEHLNFNRNHKIVTLINAKVAPWDTLAQGNKFYVSVPKFEFLGFEVDSALQKTDFIFDKIRVSNPELNFDVVDSTRNKNNKLEIAKNFNLYPYVKQYVNKVKVNSLYLDNIDLNFNWFDKPLVRRKFNLRFEDIYIAKDYEARNLLNSSEFELVTTQLSTKSKDEVYEFSVDSLIFNSKEHNTLLKHIKVSPLISAKEFSNVNAYQKDFIQINCDFIELKGLNEDLYIQDNILDADALIIGPSNFNLFRDKLLPFNENQRPPWFQDVLKNVEQTYVFDSVLLYPSELSYSERTDFSDLPGHITFNELSANFLNLTNSSEMLLQNPFLEVNASAKFLNEAPFKAHFNFDLSGNNYTHEVKGHLKNLSLSSINSLLTNTSPIEIENGYLNNLDFDLLFVGDTAKGNLTINYNNLEISIYKKRKRVLKKAKLLSFIANKFVLNSNSKQEKQANIYPVYFKRDEKRAIINFWIKSIFSGAQEALGIKRKKNKK